MLDFGIYFNTEDGVKQAEKDIKEMQVRLQSILDSNPLNIRIDSGNIQNIGTHVGSQLDTIGRNADSVGAQLKRLRAEFRNLTLADIQAGRGDALLQEYRELSRQAGIFVGTIDQAVKAQDRMRGATGRMAQSMQASTREIKKQSQAMVELKNYVMNFLSVYGAIRITKDMIAVTGEFEAQKVALQSILMDAEKGAKIFERIKELAVVSPYQVKDLVSYAKQLSAFSVPYEELYDTTKMLADVASGLGVDMGRIILAYGQVRSASVLRGQELRQFTEAGIPLVDELAKKFTELNGELVTAGEVFDLISKRQVPFEMVKEIFEELTSEGGKFYQMQERQAETLAGKVSNLADAYDVMLNEIGESNSGLLKWGVDTAKTLMVNYDKLGRVILALASAYGTYKVAMMAVSAYEKGKAIIETTARFMRLTNQITGATSAMRVYSAVSKLAFNANPIALATSAVVSLGVGLYQAVQGTNELNDAIDGAVGEVANQAMTAEAGLRRLVAQVENAEEGSYDYRNAVMAINKQYGDFLPTQLKVTDSYYDIARAAEIARRAMQANYKAQADQKAYETIMNETNDEVGGRYDKMVKLLQKEKMSKSEATKVARELVEAQAKSNTEFVKAYETLVLGGEKSNVIGKSERRNKVASEASAIVNRRIISEQRYKEEVERNSAIFGVDSYDEEMRELEKRYKAKQQRMRAERKSEDEFRADELKAQQEYYVAQLELLESHGQQKTDMYADIKRNLDALSNQGGSDWAKGVMNTQGIDNYSVLKVNESDNSVLDYIGRIRTYYAKLSKERQEYSTLTAKGSKEYVATLDGELAMMRKIAKEQGFSLTTTQKSTSVSKSRAKATNEVADAIKRLSEAERKQADELSSYRLQVERQSIDVMEEGVEKRLKLIDYEYQEELARIKKQEQDFIKANQAVEKARWEKAGKKGTLAYSTELNSEQQGLIDKATVNADIARNSAKRQLLTDMLRDYEAYADKRVKIEEEMNKKLADLEKLRNQSNGEEIDALANKIRDKAKEQLNDLSFDEFKKSDSWVKMFSDLEYMSSADIKKVIADAMSAKPVDMNPSDIKEYQEAIKKLNDELDNRGDWETFTGNVGKLASFIKSGDWDGAYEAMKRLSTQTQVYLGIMKSVSDLVKEAFGEDNGMAFAIDNTVTAVDGAINAGQAITAFMNLRPIDGLQHGIKAISNFVNVAKNIKLRKANKEIESQQKVIDGLSKEYEKLDKAIKKHVGNDKYRTTKQQAENLKKQNEAIQRQIEAERGKGKDADWGKIADMEKQMQDNADKASENMESIAESIAGTDLESGAIAFAEAWLDAYVSFGNTSDAIKAKFKEMTENMVIDAVMSSLAMSYLKPIFDQIDALSEDGNMSVDDIASVVAMIPNTIDQMDAGLTAMAEQLEEKGIKLREKADEGDNLKGISKDVAGITESTALILGGYLDSIRMKMFPYMDYMMGEHKATMASILAFQARHVVHLQAIELNTKATANNTMQLLDMFGRMIYVGSDGTRLKVLA